MNRPHYIVVKIGQFASGKGADSAYQIYVDRGEYYEAADSFENAPMLREQALAKCEWANKAIAEGTL